MYNFATRFHVGNFLLYKGQLCKITCVGEKMIILSILKNNKCEEFILRDDEYIGEIDLEEGILSCTNLVKTNSDYFDDFCEIYYITIDLYLIKSKGSCDYNLANCYIDDGDSNYNIHLTSIDSLSQLQNLMSALEEKFKIDLEKLKNRLNDF